MLRGTTSRWLYTTTAVLAVIGMLTYGFLPAAVDVDLAVASRGPLTVTVDEDGKTRVRERYIVAAPFSGRLLRTSLHSGDPIIAGETVVATIEASEVNLMDDRARAEAEARLKAAEAHREQSATLIAKARDALEVARDEMGRAEALLGKGTITAESYEGSRLKYRLASHDLRAAEFNETIAQFERDQAQAAFIRYSARPESQEPLFRHEIRAPISGRVFRVFEENAIPVSTGDRLIELGDPQDLEVEVDVLSTDAVRINPGAKVWLKHWGGDAPLVARVRLIEPSAFTKISALGIEEQRVWIIADILASSEQRTNLGDGFRVEASIVTWEAADTLKVPAGALFRRGNSWTIFAVVNSRAVLKEVQIGNTSGLETEILSGLRAGDSIILHPSDRVQPGVRIIKR